MFFSKEITMEEYAEIVDLGKRHSFFEESFVEKEDWYNDV